MLPGWPWAGGLEGGAGLAGVLGGMEPGRGTGLAGEGSGVRGDCWAVLGVRCNRAGWLAPA